MSSRPYPLTGPRLPSVNQLFPEVDLWGTAPPPPRGAYIPPLQHLIRNIPIENLQVITPTTTAAEIETPSPSLISSPTQICSPTPTSTSIPTRTPEPIGPPVPISTRSSRVKRKSPPKPKDVTTRKTWTDAEAAIVNTVLLEFPQKAQDQFTLHDVRTIHRRCELLGLKRGAKGLGSFLTKRGIMHSERQKKRMASAPRRRS